MSHPDLTFWYGLKDRVRSRCAGLCELCWRRRGNELHHRHYRSWGAERPEDVMLLCSACHGAVSGCRPWGKPLTCQPGSLLDRGDDGTDSSFAVSQRWQAYLQGLPLQRTRGVQP